MFSVIVQFLRKEEKSAVSIIAELLHSIIGLIRDINKNERITAHYRKAFYSQDYEIKENYGISENV